MNTQRRALGPITGPEDDRKALEEMTALAFETERRTDEESEYLDGLSQIVEQFDKYGFGEAKARANLMFQYLFKFGRQASLAEIETVTGVSSIPHIKAKFVKEHMQTITIKPGNELFIGPPDNKRRAYAHVGIVRGNLVIVHDPLRSYRHARATAPFTYGNGFELWGLGKTKPDYTAKVDCFGVDSHVMFKVVRVDPQNQTIDLEVQDGMAVFTRDAGDKAVADAL